MEQQELIGHLQKVRQMKHWTIRRLANEIGCNPDHLSSYMAGHYKYRAIPELAEVWLREQGSKPQAEEVVEVDTLLKINEICTDCHDFHKLSIIIGNPGTGKTESFTEHAANSEKVKYICCNSYSTMTEIATQLLDGGGNGSAAHRIELCKTALKGWLLIFDELDRVTPRVVEGLRAIYDSGGIGMVLGGTSVFMKMLSRGLQAKDNLSHLYDRAAFIVNLNNPNDEDITKYLASQGITDADARKMVRETAKKGSFRRAANDLWQAKRIAKLNDRAVDAKVLQAARLMRTFGKEY